MLTLHKAGKTDYRDAMYEGAISYAELTTYAFSKADSPSIPDELMYGKEDFYICCSTWLEERLAPRSKHFVKAGGLYIEFERNGGGSFFADAYQIDPSPRKKTLMLKIKHRDNILKMFKVLPFCDPGLDLAQSFVRPRTYRDPSIDELSAQIKAFLLSIAAGEPIKETTLNSIRKDLEALGNASTIASLLRTSGGSSTTPTTPELPLSG